VLGDLNDFEFSQTASILTGSSSLVDLPQTLPANERYSYVFEGNSQVLDHILLGGALTSSGYPYDVVHVNSEFSDQVSDHDPQVVRIPLT
jgi:predicted extracellular nuclease